MSNLRDFSYLVAQIHLADNQFRESAVKAVNQHLTIRNWLIGAYIVNYEQEGADRAVYGSKLEEKLAKKIKLKGLSARSLRLFKQFYNTYPQMLQTVSAKFNLSPEIMQTLSASFSKKQDVNAKIETDVAYKLENISFSHFVELLKVEDQQKRNFYEERVTQSALSVRELKRQIDSLTFERISAAQDKSGVNEQLVNLNETKLPSDLLKTPYVFDFLGLPDSVLASESELENALLSNLKEFILELGHGFCFEAQQKRLVIGGEYYFIDMVFYHRILKCHVLIELKIDSFKHHYAGQLNTYLQYYKKKIKEKTDNPPIGILLCTNQNRDLVEYALGGMDENLFVSQYKTVLPSAEQLTAFLTTEKNKHL